MSKLLVVFGATGTQGGSVVKTLLGHPTLSQQFKIRGITRDPSKPAGEALKDKGVEVVKADTLDKDSLRQALNGAHSVFAVTNFWEKATKEAEVTQGKNIADIAKEVGVKHLIWSSLPNVTEMTGGKLLNVPHFDGKAEVENYIKSIGVPATFLEPGVYMSGLISHLKKGENGINSMALPFAKNTPIPLFESGSDTGKFVTAILAKYDAQPLGKRILGATDWYTPDDIIRTYSEVTGQAATYTEVSSEVFKGFFPGHMGQELLETFILIKDWEYYGPGSHEKLKESLEILDEKPTSLREFVEKNGPW
jgi:uncharacterized protein YbjT (DUF2867 family)